MHKIIRSLNQLIHSIRNISFRFVLISIFLHISAASVKAADQPSNWYQIEYIIFEHLQTDEHILRYEDIPYPVKTNKPYSYVISNNHPSSPYQFTQLSEDKMDLADAYKKLKRNRSVEVLDMKSWQQALSDSSSTPPLKIDKLVSKNRTLFGELQLKKSRYTHAEFKLYLAQKKSLPFRNIKDWFLQKKTKWKLIDLLRPINNTLPFTESIGTSDIYQNIRFVEGSRRIKEGEVHYIDHPVIGIIVTMKEIPSPYQLTPSLTNDR